MFTGIIQAVGQVSGLQSTEAGRRLVIETGDWPFEAALGDSIAVDGCCLTVATLETGRLGFDVIPQTLSVTTLGRLEVGDRVNLEPPVTASTLMSGHVVQGHIDGLGQVQSINSADDGWRVRIETPDMLSAYLVHRGSIAVNGVSLTLAEMAGPVFEVALIPTTLELTNLRDLAVGGLVNLEMDYLVKTVVSWLESRGGRDR